MIDVQQLRMLKIFKETTDATLQKLARDMSEKVYLKGDVILKEGEKTGTLYLVASGSVSVQKALEGGRTKGVARLETEDFFGEMAFIEDQAHSATIVADEDARIYLLPRANLKELALDQVLALLSGISGRLRRTTRELVSVFETARLVGQSESLAELAPGLLGQLRADLGSSVSAAFYRWNPFNDEYMLIESQGPDASQFPPVVESQSDLMLNLDQSSLFSAADIARSGRKIGPLSFKAGHLVLSRIDMLSTREGLFIYYAPEIGSFDSGERQMMETISAVLAPAIESARGREEDAARRRLEQSKRTSF